MNHKAAIKYVYDNTDIDIGFNLKAYELNTQFFKNKNDVDVFLYILRPGLHKCVLTNTVDTNGKFKINASATDIFKIQKVDGSILHDALQLSFNTVDTSSILKTNNVDI